jgi:hypothetical protein
MEAITAAVQTVREHYGHVDIVNNAGAVDAQFALEDPIDVFSDVMGEPDGAVRRRPGGRSSDGRSGQRRSDR